MSAGCGLPLPTGTKVISDASILAPKFRDALDAGLAACKAAGLDAYAYETYRTNELQAIYYKRGRIVIPPTKPVTNAKTNLYSWHGYLLAADVISKSMLWSAPTSWFEKMGAIFKEHDCKWGGDWTARDLPHVQWARCKASPSDLARKLYAEGGVEAVWKAVAAA